MTMLFLLLACAPVDTETPDTNTEDEVIEDVDPGWDATGCEAIEDGRITMDIDGDSRDIEFVFPDNPEGAPVVFAWHWLGGTANQTLDWMRMASLANEGAIVVAPESTGLQGIEWDIVGQPEVSVDIALFDRVLACLHDQQDIDTGRITTTGMSAGGLMSSYLILYRSDVLSAAAPFSGGIEPAWYSTPEVDIPVLLTWGGPSDTYGGYSFHTSTLAFSESLQNDGHIVVECMNDLGHLPPDDAAEMAWAFFEAAPLTEGFEGVPAGLPGYCE
jgi:dienelactone hydrolase